MGNSSASAIQPMQVAQMQQAMLQQQLQLQMAGSAGLGLGSMYGSLTPQMLPAPPAVGGALQPLGAPGARAPKRRREGDVLTEGEVQIKLAVNNIEAGTLIGKGGANIKEIRASGCYALIGELPSGGTERVATFTGAPETVQAALSCVVEKLEGTTPTAENESRVFRVLVPNEQIGSLIGKGGVKAKSIREASGSSMTISNSSEATEYSPDRVVTLSGQPLQILAALHSITQQLASHPIEDRGAGGFDAGAGGFDAGAGGQRAMRGNGALMGNSSASAIQPMQVAQMQQAMLQQQLQLQQQMAGSAGLGLGSMYGSLTPQMSALPSLSRMHGGLPAPPPPPGAGLQGVGFGASRPAMSRLPAALPGYFSNSS